MIINTLNFWEVLKWMYIYVECKSLRTSIMTLQTIISFITLLFVTDVLGQTRTMSGKVIEHEFNPLSQVWILNADTVLLSKSDTGGNFSITIPSDTKTLIVATVGMEMERT